MSEATWTAERISAHLPLGSAVIEEAELWIGAQGDLLGGIEMVMTSWMRRQREAIETSSRSIQKICEARSVFDWLQAHNELVSNCLRWTASEICAVGEDTTAIARKATQRLGERSERLQQSAPLQPATAE